MNAGIFIQTPQSNETMNLDIYTGSSSEESTFMKFKNKLTHPSCGDRDENRVTFGGCGFGLQEWAPLRTPPAGTAAFSNLIWAAGAQGPPPGKLTPLYTGDLAP